MSGFFTDIMNDPNINWGNQNLKIRKSYRANDYGVNPEISSEILDWNVLGSLQLLDTEDLVNAGAGQYAGRIVYELLTLDNTNLQMNSDSMIVRTVILNDREYEIMESSFFGINGGTLMQDGYYQIRFASISKTQSGVS